MTPPRAKAQPAEHRVALRILDHQVVGPDDELLGNVDDVEIVVSHDGWFVTALLVGPGALGRRLPGKLGEWTVAIWRRLQTSPDARPARVGIEEVTDFGSAVTVSASAAEVLAASFGLELWLREFVVSRIPGAKGGGDERDEEMQDETAGERPARATTAVSGRAMRTSSAAQVIGVRVFGRDGSELGVVQELLCVGPGTGHARDHLRVTHIQYGHHAAGSQLGYDSDARQGPLVVGAVVRWWQRGHRVAPIGDVVDVDLEAGTLRVASHDGHVHPHELRG
jgi:hypothetical protein